MTNKPIILIFSDWYVPGHKAGGPIQSIYNLANILSKHFEVKVICDFKDLNSDKPYQGIQYNQWIKLKEDHYVMYLDESGKRISFIKEIVKLNRDNIIYINGIYSFKFSFLPALLVYYYNISKCFISVRGMLHASALSVKPFKKQVFLAFVRGFGLYKKCILLASSQNEINEINKSIRGHQIKIAANVPMLPQDIIKKSRQFKSSESIVKFLFLGRISPEKNPLSLVAALMQIEKPCYVTFCGESLDTKYLELFKSKMSKLPAHIQWNYIVNLPHTEISSVLNDHDVMVLPSLGENFGHAIFESFLHGLPVIIGDNTPWKDIESKKAGLLVKPNDIQSITKALNQFIDMDVHEYEHWKAGALKRSQDYFNENNFEEMYLRLFS